MLNEAISKTRNNSSEFRNKIDILTSDRISSPSNGHQGEV